jgi:hypothetical protein
VAAAEGHTSCAELFKAERAFKGERNGIQAPPQLCSLLHFRFHHRLELRMTPRVLVLFLLHDLLLDLDARLRPLTISIASG